MSGIPNRDAYSIYTVNDHSHHKNFYRSYTNEGYHASEQGAIYINPQFQHDSPLISPLEELEKNSSPRAAFDSKARFDPPRCAESTRLGIIQIIEEWINSDGDEAAPSNLFWLHGGAGVGKSALAQSLSERFQEKKQLAASFFFFRDDERRNDGDYLIPTLVSHLLNTFKGIRPFVEERIRENYALFTKRYEIQLNELLVEPLLALKSKGAPVTHPRLIVIDGLDECRNPEVQRELLRVIAHVIPRIPYPLRFFIASRPEAHITHVFDHNHDLQAVTVRRYNLSNDPDADMDIRKFLEKEFAGIRQVHRLARHLPRTWPDQNAISSVVERSSGHFIYASTVIRYIRSLIHRPDDRLEVILRLRPPQEGDQPYAQLDALYALIFDGVPKIRHRLETICLVLGMLYFQSKGISFYKMVRDVTTTEKLLGMRAGDLVLLLDPILSLVSIDDDDTVRILHKSLYDYLLDTTRSGHLPFDLARPHELAAVYILEERVMKDVHDIHDWRSFAYYCQYAYLSGGLRDYLQALAVPCHKSILTTPKTSRDFGGDLVSLFIPLTSSIWHFFRTMSREDFDPTGRLYKRYVEKWMSYLHIPIKQSMDPVQKNTDLRIQTTPDLPVQGTSDHPFSIFDRLGGFLKRKPPTESRSQNSGGDTNVEILKHKPHPESKSSNVEASSNVTGLKHELDALLMEWKPPKATPIDARMSTARRVAIEQEHNIFSAYASATFSGNKMIGSSLIFGDFFIHGYNFGITDKESFLILRTYSRHGDACYKDERVGKFDIVREAQKYLSRVGKYLYSDIYQKYGVEPDEMTFNA